jgi:hypothetical protein
MGGGHASGDQRRAAACRTDGAYAGIGSRKTPPEMLALMSSIGARLGGEGWVLRTGASPGADEAFLRGAYSVAAAVELYLPWPDFASATPLRPQPTLRVLARPSERAYELAARFHPRWDRLAERTRALLARDAHEVLGADLASPARLVICWTAEGSLDGEGVLADGTGQALRVAAHHGIPVLNLALANHRRCIEHLRRTRELLAARVAGLLADLELQ